MYSELPLSSSTIHLSDHRQHYVVTITHNYLNALFRHKVLSYSTNNCIRITLKSLYYNVLFSHYNVRFPFTLQMYNFKSGTTKSEISKHQKEKWKTSDNKDYSILKYCFYLFSWMRKTSLLKANRIKGQTGIFCRWGEVYEQTKKKWNQIKVCFHFSSTQLTTSWCVVRFHVTRGRKTVILVFLRNLSLLIILGKKF